jgi:hypothetical protein
VSLLLEFRLGTQGHSRRPSEGETQSSFEGGLKRHSPFPKIILSITLLAMKLAVKYRRDL